MIEIILTFLSLVLCYIDLTLGMGYGTLLTPLLLILGFNPLHVISAVLISQLAGNVTVVILHHLFGNADFSLRSNDLKIGLIFGISGIFASFIAYFININIDTFILKIYISLMTMAMGVLIYPSHFYLKKKSNGSIYSKKAV